MQEDLKTFTEKPCKYLPPVLPKPKHYQKSKDYFNSISKETHSLESLIEDKFKCGHTVTKTKSNKDPPPVPPKPAKNISWRTPKTFHELVPSIVSASNLRSKNNNANYLINKRNGIFVMHETPPHESAFSFSEISNTTDAFTTEDKDLFSNTRSPSQIEKFVNGDTSCESNTENMNEADLELPGESNSLSSQDNCCKVTVQQSSCHISTYSQNHSHDISQYDIYPQINESCRRNEGMRPRLTGSVSFTSFDSIRNSTVKEVNLKKQILKQLLEKSERVINCQKSFDEMCLGEGDFSDEEENIEPENGIAIANSLHLNSLTRTDMTEKLHKIACELLSTEESYVKRLYLIDQVFHFKIVLENRERNMFPKEQILQMFPNIKSIYEFHNDFLLKHLRQRIEEWEKTPKIGDIMKKFAPFLKLYTGYVQNFDSAINVIKFWTERSREFCNLLEKLQKLPECEQMSLQHHMLEPIQRVPRYLVLLREYVKCLPEDSNDMEDSMDALELVEKAASHSNESLRVCDIFQKMLSINEWLGNVVNVIVPGRRFIKDGVVKRISPKDGSTTNRYLFLFNDMLIICQGVFKLRHHFKIKMKLDTADLQLVEESCSLKTPESFYLICKEKYLELLACDQKLRKEWIFALNSCINSYKLRKESTNFQMELNNENLGKRAPFWTKNHETSMCMICTNNFTIFLKKRHCHACGIVVCTKCSPNKIQLEFTANKSNRVCNNCYTTLQGSSCLCSNFQSSPTKYHHSLKMKAFDNHVLCGYLKLSQDKKNWQDLYVTINKNFVLYTFKAHKDVKAYSSLPLPGYYVDILPQEPKVFVIFHKGWTARKYFSSNSESVTNLWVKILKIVVGAELPSDREGCMSEKCPHQSMLS